MEGCILSELWRFAAVEVQRGEKVVAHLRVPGASSEVPVFIVNGAQDGPNVLIMAGIHGCEYTSIDAALQLGRRLDPVSVRGTVTVMPIVNPDAFFARSIYVHPEDRKNLNRCFPGQAEGSAAEQLAHWLFTNAIMPVDYVIDLHGGDMIESLVPFSIYYETGDAALDARAQAFACAFGIRYVVASTEEVPGSTYGAAAQAGKIAMIAEAGQQGILEPAASQTLQSGTENVLRLAGVLAGDVLPTECTVLNTYDWYRAPFNGLWYPEVQVGAYATVGERLGTIRNLFGDIVETVTARTKGTLLFVVTSLAINEGDPLLAISDAT